jgi:hypothetical protein
MINSCPTIINKAEDTSSRATPYDIYSESNDDFLGGYSPARNARIKLYGDFALAVIGTKSARLTEDRYFYEEACGVALAHQVKSASTTSEGVLARWNVGAKLMRSVMAQEFNHAPALTKRTLNPISTLNIAGKAFGIWREQSVVKGLPYKVTESFSSLAIESRPDVIDRASTAAQKHAHQIFQPSAELARFSLSHTRKARSDEVQVSGMDFRAREALEAMALADAQEHIRVKFIRFLTALAHSLAAVEGERSVILSENDQFSEEIAKAISQRLNLGFFVMVEFIRTLYREVIISASKAELQGSSWRLTYENGMLVLYSSKRPIKRDADPHFKKAEVMDLNRIERDTI